MPEMGNLLYTPRQNNAYYTIYFDVSIKLRERGATNNYQLENGQTVYMCRDAQDYPIFIDTSANIVLCHIYKNNKIRVSINKVAGILTKAAFSNPLED